MLSLDDRPADTWSTGSERNDAMALKRAEEEVKVFNPSKPKIAAWGGRTRHLLAMPRARKPETPLPASDGIPSRPLSQVGEVEVDCRKPLRPRIGRPRPVCRPNPNLEHTVLLRPNEFTTSTTQYRTYGTQWVLTQHRTKQGKGLLAAEVERDRAELAQREELLQQSSERIEIAKPDCSPRS